MENDNISTDTSFNLTLDYTSMGSKITERPENTVSQLGILQADAVVNVTTETNMMDDVTTLTGRDTSAMLGLNNSDYLMDMFHVTDSWVPDLLFVENITSENNTYVIHGTDIRFNVSVTPPGDDIAIPMAEALIFALLTSLCIVVTIVGNILVILSVFTYRPLKCVQNFFIVSLAVADLAVASLVMPFNIANFIIGHWVFGAIFCQIWLTFDILICTASILNLCAIALDRYYAIHDPLSYAQKRTFNRVIISIVLVWAISGIISIPPLIGWNNKAGSLFNPETKQCMLTDEKSYVIYSASGSFFIPLLIMTFVYVNIFRATRKRLRQRAKAAAAAHIATKTGKEATMTKMSANTENSTDSPEETQDNCEGCNLTDKEVVYPKEKSKKEDSVKFVNSNDKPNNTGFQMHKFLEEKQKISLSRERRAARTMAIIMSSFVLCWLPFFLMYVIFPFCESCVANTDPRLINFIVWLGYLNSAFNPIIYTIFNIDFRRAFKKLLLGRCSK